MVNWHGAWLDGRVLEFGELKSVALLWDCVHQLIYQLQELEILHSFQGNVPEDAVALTITIRNAIRKITSYITSSMQQMVVTCGLVLGIEIIIRPLNITTMLA